jgi:hypothetical protein
MNRFVIILGVVLIAAAYIGGYWPEHRRLEAAQQSETRATQSLAGVQTVGRICVLENDAMALIDQTTNQNYGNARNLSNNFFDAVRRQADLEPNSPYKGDLENILGQRDAVTAGLARADASTVTTLKQILAQLQQIMQKASSQADL